MSENLDQTSFSETAQLTTQSQTAPQNATAPVPTNSKKKILLLALGVAVLCVLIVALIVRTPKKTVLPTATPVATVKPQQTETSDLEKKIQETENRVQNADPFANNLPLPPVDFHIRLKGVEELNH